MSASPTRPTNHSQSPGSESVPAFSFTLAPDPTRAMQEMMEIIDQMRDVYTRETEALEASNTKTFMALQDEKLNKARHYQEGIQQLLFRRKEIQNVDKRLKIKLESMQNDFSNLVERNKEALERMQRCIDRIGSKIREAAKDAARQDRAVSYGESGKIQSNEKQGVSMGISETA